MKARYISTLAWVSAITVASACATASAPESSPDFKTKSPNAETEFIQLQASSKDAFYPASIVSGTLAIDNDCLMVANNIAVWSGDFEWNAVDDGGTVSWSDGQANVGDQIRLGGGARPADAVMTSDTLIDSESADRIRQCSLETGAKNYVLLTPLDS